MTNKLVDENTIEGVKKWFQKIYMLSWTSQCQDFSLISDSGKYRHILCHRMSENLKTSRPKSSWNEIKQFKFKKSRPKPLEKQFNVAKKNKLVCAHPERHLIKDEACPDVCSRWCRRCKRSCHGWYHLACLGQGKVFAK